MRVSRLDEAKPLLRHAYVVLARLSPSQANSVFEALMEACGSAEAATEYVSKLFEVHEVD
jgi:hypothetical protein